MSGCMCVGGWWFVQLANGFKRGGSPEEGVQRDRAEHDARAGDAAREDAEGAGEADAGGEAAQDQGGGGAQERLAHAHAGGREAPRAQAQGGGGAPQARGGERVQHAQRSLRPHDQRPQHQHHQPRVHHLRHGPPPRADQGPHLQRPEQLLPQGPHHVPQGTYRRRGLRGRRKTRQQLLPRTAGAVGQQPRPGDAGPDLQAAGGQRLDSADRPRGQPTHPRGRRQAQLQRHREPGLGAQDQRHAALAEPQRDGAGRGVQPAAAGDGRAELDAHPAGHRQQPGHEPGGRGGHPERAGAQQAGVRRRAVHGVHRAEAHAQGGGHLGRAAAQPADQEAPQRGHRPQHQDQEGAARRGVERVHRLRATQTPEGDREDGEGGRLQEDQEEEEVIRIQVIININMGKKIRYQYLTGALLRPYFRFINRIDVGINPVSDPRGARIAQHLYNFANSTRPLFKGEKFQSSMAYDLASNNSWATFTYLNGMRQGFLLKHIDMNEYNMEKVLIDKVVEFQRACDGFEDEYEDEVRK